jgi:hypothetical protein
MVRGITAIPGGSGAHNTVVVGYGLTYTSTPDCVVTANTTVLGWNGSLKEDGSAATSWVEGVGADTLNNLTMTLIVLRSNATNTYAHWVVWGTVY